MSDTDETEHDEETDESAENDSEDTLRDTVVGLNRELRQTKRELETVKENIDHYDEPFIFRVFRDEEGAVTSYVLMMAVQMGVEGVESYVPVHTGCYQANEITHEYKPRHAQRECKRPTFASCEYETVEPHREFYEWVNVWYEALEEFNELMSELESEYDWNDEENPVDQHSVKPDIPRIPPSIPQYQQETLHRMAEIVNTHRELTMWMSYLTDEAIDRHGGEDSESEEEEVVKPIGELSPDMDE